MAFFSTTTFDVSSPYYLHHSHHPGLIISPEILTGESYRNWKSSLHRAFHAMRKLGFLDGTIKRPSDDSPDLQNWITVNYVLVSWLLQTIDPSLRSSFTHRKTAKELWDDLAKRFSPVNEEYQIRYELYNCRQNGRCMAEYYGEFTKLWGELNSLVPPRICTCGGCKCGYNEAVVVDRQRKMVYDFLIGLDDYYKILLCSKVVGQEPLPSLGRVHEEICKSL